MYKSGEKYLNRHGKVYWFEKHNDSEMMFFMSEDYQFYRIGGKSGEDIDYNDLGMFDPAGGPYISIGTVIDGMDVKRIRKTHDGKIIVSFESDVI